MQSPLSPVVGEFYTLSHVTFNLPQLFLGTRTFPAFRCLGAFRVCHTPPHRRVPDTHM